MALSLVASGCPLPHLTWAGRRPEALQVNAMSPTDPGRARPVPDGAPSPAVRGSEGEGFSSFDGADERERLLRFAANAIFQALYGGGVDRERLARFLPEYPYADCPQCIDHLARLLLRRRIVSDLPFD